MRWQVGKCPVESTDWRAGGAHNDDIVFHQKLLLRRRAGGIIDFGTAASSADHRALSTTLTSSDIPEKWGFFARCARAAPSLAGRAAPPQIGGPAKRKLAMLNLGQGNV